MIVVDKVLEAVTARTRLVLIDHVTSQTGLVLPIERAGARAGRRGVETLVDGAHAPGMLDLNVDRHRGGVLHRQLPQVDVRAQGRGLPSRTP